MRWLLNHPRALEAAYTFTKNVLISLWPILSKAGPRRLNRAFIPFEELSKQAIFGCRMCGQCVLHSTGMTCPMTCPKSLRNGPCGGVRQNGHCEVRPDMPCVWVQAWERSAQMGSYGAEIRLVQPPVNMNLKGTSAWVNMLTGADKKTQPGWPAA